MLQLVFELLLPERGQQGGAGGKQLAEGQGGLRTARDDDVFNRSWCFHVIFQQFSCFFNGFEAISCGFARLVALRRP